MTVCRCSRWTMSFDGGLKYVFKGLGLGFVEGEWAEGRGAIDTSKQGYGGGIDLGILKWLGYMIELPSVAGLVDGVFDLVIPFGFDVKVLWGHWMRSCRSGAGVKVSPLYEIE